MNHKSLRLSDNEVVVGDQAVTPDSSVVGEWLDPIDIGEAYPPIGEIKTGDTILADPYDPDSGDEVDDCKHTVGFIGDDEPDRGSPYVEGEIDDLLEAHLKEGSVPRVDYIWTNDGLTYITTYSFSTQEHPDGKLAWAWDKFSDYRPKPRMVKYGSVPFVILSESNYDSDAMNLVGLDRFLNYKLPIYLEVQTQSVEGEVRRERVVRLISENTMYFTLMSKNEPLTWKNGPLSAEMPEEKLIPIRIGDKGNYLRASVSILPYTEMEKIDLPASINIGSRNIVIPAGHTFRPYRILSPSYVMYGASQTYEALW